MNMSKICYLFALASLLVTIVLSVLKKSTADTTGVVTFVFLALGVITTVISEILKPRK